MRIAEHTTRFPEPVLPGIGGSDQPEGPVAAAVVAGGVGCLALGVLTTLAEASAGLKDWLSWKDDVGPLSGKTGMAILVWLISWAVLHVVFRHRPVEIRRMLTVALVLVGLGVLGTFPTFFQAFAGE